MNDASCGLADRKCKPCEGGVPPLSEEEVNRYLETLTGWKRDGLGIARAFEFRNHYEVMAFVNAVAWVSHREDHHPDIQVGYRECRIHYHTHAIHGLSENDFICAAKVDSLLDL